jgi:hypothetical protein
MLQFAPGVKVYLALKPVDMRYCSDCETCRRIKDSGKRKIRTVFGRVEISNPRFMNPDPINGSFMTLRHLTMKLGERLDETITPPLTLPA